MMEMIRVRTAKRVEMVDITDDIQRELTRCGVREGICVVYVPHTTAAVTVNEGADPAVQADILMELNKTIPFDDGYRHMEGNSAAHIKSTLVGPGEMLLVHQGRLVLGTWQRVFFCEFDGPRNRKVFLGFVKESG